MSERKAFVSRPSTRNDEQERFINHIDDLLDNRGLDLVSIGQEQYPIKAPIQAVKNEMETCEGALILGLKQLHMIEGEELTKVEEEDDTLEENSSDEVEWTTVEELYLPTPWNHIEAGMAYMLDLPLLIVKEEGVEGIGIFDVGSSDRYIHQATMTEDWLESPEFIQPFNKWYDEIVQQS